MIDWPVAATQGSLLAAAINGVLAGVLWCTRRWWSLGGTAPTAPTARTTESIAPQVPQSTQSPQVPTSLTAGPGHSFFWIALAVILIGATGLRIPLAGASLWWDEVWQARHASMGDWRPDRKNPGQWKFRETTVAQALWNYRKPANHPPMSVASKACHTVWKKLTGARPGEFREWVLRLPGLVASLAGIALIALLLRVWGQAGAGLMAALFLALHPWHIRYGLDNRGYTFLVPLTLIGLWALWRACGPRPAASPAEGGTDGEAGAAVVDARDGRRTAGAWWVFGLTQALLLWSHLLSVWVCLALCATGVWWIGAGHTGPDRWRRLARLVAVQIAGAMVFFQLFLPNLLQAMQWGEKNQDGQVLDGALVWHTLTEAATGPVRGWGALVVWGVAGVGCGLAWWRRFPGRVALSLLLVAAGLFLGVIGLTGFYFYPRFLFAVTVPLAMAVGLAVWWAGGRAFGRRRPARAVGTAAVFAAMAGGGWGGGLKPVVAGGFSPLRETADVLRRAEAEGAHVFGYGFGAEALQYYLPTLPYAREADAPEALAAALEKARAAGRPLLVATGYEDLNRLTVPAGFALLDDASRAPVVWSGDGLEPQFAYRIRRLE
jgi:hypothetical protein